MIIFECDLCGVQRSKLNTIILYKQKIDYCKDCAKEIVKLKKDFQKEVEELRELQIKHIDSTLRTKEKLLIRNYKR